MASNGLSLPDDFDGYPFEAKVAVLAGENDQADLRAAVDNVLGRSDDTETPSNVTKGWLAACLLALGGPNEADVGNDGRR